MARNSDIKMRGTEEFGQSRRRLEVATDKSPALRIPAAHHDSQSLASTRIPAPARRTKTFREMLCSSLPDLASTSAAASTTSIVTETKSNDSAAKTSLTSSYAIAPSSATANNGADQVPSIVKGNFEPTSVETNTRQSNTDPFERRSKGLKDSRWAKEEDPTPVSTLGLKSSRWAKPEPSLPLPKPTPSTGKSTHNLQPKREVPRHRPQKSRRSRPEEKKEEESTRELPRVIFDMEEFQREVAEQGLKTLKDSRWA